MDEFPVCPQCCSRVCWALGLAQLGWDQDSLQVSPVEPQPVPLEHTGELGARVLQALHEILLAERADLGRILHRENPD